MNRLLISIAILATCTTMAAQTASLRVGYTAQSPNVRKVNETLTNRYILLAGAEGSKFYSPRTEALDSLQSTPAGEKAYKEMAKNAYFGGNINDLPTRDGTYYVTKDATQGSLTHYDLVGIEKYRYTEPLPQIDWTISDSTKTILGYECILATADFNGRRWKAWFAPEIPLQEGPWKLQGLPGLILEAIAEDAPYHFVATGIEPCSVAITPVYSADTYSTSSRKEYLKAKRNFYENPIAQMNAQLAGKNIKIGSADGNPLPQATTLKEDFLETDYR